jgi:hypothetical protein
LAYAKSAAPPLSTTGDIAIHHHVLSAGLPYQLGTPGLVIKMSVADQ